MANYAVFYHIKNTPKEEIKSFVVIHQGKQSTIYKNFTKFLNRKKNILQVEKTKLNTEKLISDFFETEKYLNDGVEPIDFEIEIKDWEKVIENLNNIKNRKDLMKFGNQKIYNEHMWNNFLVLVDEEKYSILDIWSENISETSIIKNQIYNWDEELKIKSISKDDD